MTFLEQLVEYLNNRFEIYLADNIKFPQYSASICEDVDNHDHSFLERHLKIKAVTGKCKEHPNGTKEFTVCQTIKNLPNYPFLTSEAIKEIEEMEARCIRPTLMVIRRRIRDEE